MMMALRDRFAWLPAPGTLLVVAVLMVGLYGVDRWLAALETREVEAEARGLYAAGQQMLRVGRAADAVDNFRRARYLDRANRGYELALANAQLANRRADEAKVTLEDVLDRDSNDAQANLLMARALASSREWSDADSYYHRAIYGEWRGNSEREKNSARVELAELLAKEGKKQELLSEVLLLANGGQSNDQNGGQSDAGLRRKIAGFYLEAGSAARAADAYRTMIRDNSQDGDAYLGLGQAELQLGQFQGAQAAFSSAVRLLPENVQAKEQVQLAQELVDLDPTSRRLSSAEKFRRSQKILALTADSVADCFQGKHVPEGLRGLLDSAEQAGAQKTPASPSNELSEARLELAGEIWKASLSTCESKAGNGVLSVIHKRLDR